MHERYNAEHIISLIKERIQARFTGKGKHATGIEGFLVTIRHGTYKLEDSVYQPSVGVVIQGEKASLIGADQYRYGQGGCLVTGIDIPATWQVIGASIGEPFLAVCLHLDKEIIADLMAGMPAACCEESELGKGVSVTEAEGHLLDAFLRLLDLGDSPARIPVLAPMILREIHYLLLTGPQGPRLRMLHTAGSQSHQIAQALAWLKQNYRDPFQVEDLARRVNMGVSTFHRHFKQLTSMSPLQYQKQLRLHEARRILSREAQDVTRAGFAVGYDSPSQFSREYKRLFGLSPVKDMAGMRGPGGAGARLLRV